VCSIQVLPLRDATVLNFTIPIFTAILATLLLNERWGLHEAVGDSTQL
jgi:drug/metabolite transporter (DMT)-like permease